jgi:uncharacterized protein with NAD-binding domain and iron-sulfur cluster
MAKQRVVVLGGGLGSLATLFHLTESPDWREQFDVTLYQQGWRLGGKCASGRDLSPQYGSRILEHGLHLFAGFYNYSFAMLRRCYEALDRPQGHPNRRVWDAFIGLDAITLMDRVVSPDGDISFDPWYINFEAIEGEPGVGLEAQTVPELMAAMIKLLGGLDPGLSTLSATGSGADSGGFLKRAFDGLMQLVDRTVIDVSGAIVRAAIANLEKHAGVVAEQGSGVFQVKPIARMRMSIYLVQTIIHGMLVDEVLTRGFDHLDQWELKDWIRRHAEAVAREYKNDVPDPVAAAAALADSPIVRGSYDYVFGYADGDPDRPAQGAGTALRGCLRLVCGYKGHLFYAMRGGMGDVVIAPLYQELLRRGVRFQFFSRVESLTPGDTAIEAIEISEQAKLVNGGYDPLINVPLPGWPADAPLPSWPAEPLWDQLENGNALKASGVDFEAPWSVAPTRRTLRRGEDFDLVVLGIPVGELKRICVSLPAARPAWGRMLNALATTRTLALQLWFLRTNEDLGCDEPGRTLTGNAQPLSCWADMTHLVSREVWNGAERPQSIAYFCGQMRGGAASDADEAATATAQAGQAARAWLLGQASRQWPAAISGDSSFGLDPNVLADPEQRLGEDRFLGQYWRANTTPSELYVQHVPGSLETRMRANESGFDNLFLCGDWTRNGLNAGAAESAVMSGVICANALLGSTAPIAGEEDLVGPMTPSNANEVQRPPYPPLVLTPQRMTGFPPGIQRDCRLHTFCVDGDPKRMQAALDATFAAPSAGAVRYDAVGSKLYISIAEIGRMASTDPGDAQRGWMQEIDVTIWVLARVAGALALRWIPLWLFVEPPPALVTGREVYGFPKQTGRFDFSPPDQAGRRFLTSTFVIRTFAPSTKADWAPLIEFTPSAAAPEPGAGGLWGGLEDLARRVVSRLQSAAQVADPALLKTATEAMSGGGSTLAFLKQFPDAADPRRACYQAIIEADCRVLALRSAGLTAQAYRAEVHSYASHPLEEQLGIRTGLQEIGHGVVMDFDFSMELGREMWRAG